MKDMKQSSNPRVEDCLSFRSISCTSALLTQKRGMGQKC